MTAAPVRGGGLQQTCNAQTATIIRAPWTNPAVHSQTARHTQYLGGGRRTKKDSNSMSSREIPHILQQHKLLPIVTKTSMTF